MRRTILSAASYLKLLSSTKIFNLGHFAWIEDLEGNRVELWEPEDQVK